MTTRFTYIAVLVAGLVFVPAAARPALDAAGSARQTPSTPATGQPPQPDKQQMAKMHEQMMAEMKAADAKLDALLKEMNAATGEARLDAVVAVVNELARQNKAMHAHMAEMHGQMMGPGRMMKPKP